MFDNHSKPDRQKWRSGFIFGKNSPILGELERNGNKKPWNQSPEAGVKIISYYNLSAVILRRFAISTSAPLRRSRSMSLKSSGLPLLRPLNL